MKRHALVARALVVAALALGCSAADDDDGDALGQAQNNALTCMAGAMRACACLGQALTGMQSCNTTGNGYGACTGCPALATNAGAGGASSSVGDVVGATRDAGKQSADGVGGTMDAGKGDASTHQDSGVSLPAGAEPGVSCGVGLPALCDLQTQKCCVRSLQTDTCIASDAKCECPLDGCTVMEARCDGPEDCMNGQICCGTFNNNNSGYQTFACSATCAATGNQRQACHGDETPCPSGLTCANSQLLTNVQVCIDPASIDQ